MREVKSFNVRFPVETWTLLKNMSIIQQRSMINILEGLVEEKRKKFEKAIAKS